MSGIRDNCYFVNYEKKSDNCQNISTIFKKESSTCQELLIIQKKVAIVWNISTIARMFQQFTEYYNNAYKRWQMSRISDCCHNISKIVRKKIAIVRGEK